MELYLTPKEGQDLIQALVDAGLASPEGRKDLLAGIDPGYVAALPGRESPLAQITSDLERMNGLAYLAGRQVPLCLWLENAARRMALSGPVVTPPRPLSFRKNPVPPLGGMVIQ